MSSNGIFYPYTNEKYMFVLTLNNCKIGSHDRKIANSWQNVVPLKIVLLNYSRLPFKNVHNQYSFPIKLLGHSNYNCPVSGRYSDKGG